MLCNADIFCQCYAMSRYSCLCTTIFLAPQMLRISYDDHEMMTSRAQEHPSLPVPLSGFCLAPDLCALPVSLISSVVRRFPTLIKCTWAWGPLHLPSMHALECSFRGCGAFRSANNMYMPSWCGMRPRTCGQRVHIPNSRRRSHISDRRLNIQERTSCAA